MYADNAWVPKVTCSCRHIGRAPQSDLILKMQQYSRHNQCDSNDIKLGAVQRLHRRKLRSIVALLK